MGKGEPRSGSTEPGPGSITDSTDAVSVESAARVLASSTSSNELPTMGSNRHDDAEGRAAPTVVQSGLGRSLAESSSSADDDHAVVESGTNANAVPSDGTSTGSIGGGIGGAMEGGSGPLPGGIPGGAPDGTLIVDKDGMPIMTHYTVSFEFRHQPPSRSPPSSPASPLYPPIATAIRSRPQIQDGAGLLATSHKP